MCPLTAHSPLGPWCVWHVSIPLCGMGVQRSASAHEIFLVLAASPIRLAYYRSTRFLKMFEPSASQAMPCLAGLQVRGNKPRGKLNHGLCCSDFIELASRVC